MTSYQRGFLTKCAEYGVPEGMAVYMLKLANAKPGFDIFGRPLAAPVPTPQQQADAEAAGVSQPATAAARPVPMRASGPDTAAAAAQQPAPKYQYAKPGFDIFGRPLAASATATSQKTDATEPAATGSAAGGTATAPAPNPPAGTVPSKPSASVAPAAAAASAPKQKRQASVDTARRARPATHDVQPARSTRQSSFKPSVDQQNLQKAWDNMTPEQRQKNLQRVNMTEEGFNALNDENRLNTMARMRDSFRKQEKRKPLPLSAYGYEPQPREPRDTDMVAHPDGNGAYIDRASYNRIMQSRAQNKRPTRGQVADRLAAGRGVANAANYRDQQARLAGQGGTPGNRMPRYSNGALAMIDLHGRPISPTLRGSGRPVRRI